MSVFRRPYCRQWRHLPLSRVALPAPAGYSARRTCVRWQGNTINDTSFWYPDFLGNSAWLEHAPFALWITGASRPRRLVELGTRSGHSYFAFCQAVRLLALDTRCHGVGQWTGEAASAFSATPTFRTLEAHNRRYAEFSQLQSGSVEDALGTFRDGTIDLLHIERGPLAAHAMRDFDRWRPKLSDRAVVLIPGTAMRAPDTGLLRLWQALRAEFPSFDFPHGEGLGVLGYGANLPAEVAAFFRAVADPAAAAERRATYAQLGTAIGSDPAARRIANGDAAPAIETSPASASAAPPRPADGAADPPDPGLHDAATAAAEAAGAEKNWPEALDRWLGILEADSGGQSASLVDRAATACIGIMRDRDGIDRAMSVLRGLGARSGTRKSVLAAEAIGCMRAGRTDEAAFRWAVYRLKALEDGDFAETPNPRLPAEDGGNERFVETAADSGERDGNPGKLCIYTAIFGDYDEIESPAYRPAGVDFICFTDRNRALPGWDVRVVDPGMNHPVAQNRAIKLLPHRYLSGYDASLYVDANVTFLADPGAMIRQWLHGKPFVAWRHPLRSDVYDECEAILAGLRNDPSAILAQHAFFQQEKLPRHTGLISCGFLWRDHRDAGVGQLMELWWDHVSRFGRRDQPGLGYLMWKTGIRPQVMPKHLGTIYENAFIALRSHRTTLLDQERASAPAGRAAIRNFVEDESRSDIAALANGNRTRIQALSAAIAAREAELDAALALRDGQIEGLKQQLKTRDAHTRALRERLSRVYASTSWRITAPMRFLRRPPRPTREEGTAYLLGALRTAYHRAPLPRALKLRLKSGLFRLIAPLLRDTAAYQNQELRTARAEGVHPSGKAWWYGFLPTAEGDGAPSDGDKGSKADVAGALARMARQPEPPAIVVPVFNAAEETARCLLALLRHTPPACRIIVIDDASTDPATPRMLAGFRGLGAIELHRNDENLGYTRTVNRGMDLAGPGDVVFLNSDTEVTPGWLRNLRLAVYSGDKVGTATPFSDNAGAFSAPEAGARNEIPAPLDLDGYGRAVSQVSRRSYPTVPTGSGFCLYVRGDCLEAIGKLDESAFPRGYGEENDLCMRALRLGWSHVIDDATLVHHVRSASFGEARTELQARGRKLLDRRYPEYATLLRKFGDPSLAAARQRVRRAGTLAARPETRGPQPRVLFVISTRTGGTRQTNQDLMAALENRLEALVLHCDATTLSLMHFVEGNYVALEKIRLRETLKAFPHRSAEYDSAVAEWLVHYAIELVHIRHISWHGLGLIDMAKAIGLPVVFSFHDFYSVCPTVGLLDENNVFCAGRCTATTGQCRHELWREPDFPPLKNAAVHAWRKQLAGILERCDAFVTTSHSARAVLIENYPFLERRIFPVIPHGRDFAAFDRVAEPLAPGEPLRILFPGNINSKKGGEFIAGLGKIAGERHLEVHVLGKVVEDFDGFKHVIQHGEYVRSDFAEKVRAIRPHIGGVLSIWPETYCHTLTELWASGIPVIGFDLGAVAERIRESGAGWVVAETSLTGVIDVIEGLRADPGALPTKIAAVHRWQEGTGRRNDCAAMSDEYFKLYGGLVEGDGGVAISAEAPARAKTDSRTVGPILAGVAANRPSGWRSAGMRSVLALVPKRADGDADGTGYIRVVRPLRHASLSRLCRLSISDGNPAEIGHHHAVLVQRDAVRTPDEAAQIVERCRSQNLRLIYEIDDDLFHLPANHSASGRFPPPVLAAMETIARAADTVVVSTAPLRERMTALNGNVRILPNALDERLWQAPSGSAVARKADTVGILYMGTRTHDGDLALVLPAIEKLRRRYGDRVTFTCIGVFNGPPRAGIAVETVPRSARNYPGFAQWMVSQAPRFDIGIAPLVANEFNRHKSGIKYLDYAACGLTPVVSDATAYRGTVAHGETGLLVSQEPDAWYEALCRLVEDRALRERLARNAQADLLARHTLAAQAPDRRRFWEAILG